MKACFFRAFGGPEVLQWAHCGAVDYEQSTSPLVGYTNAGKSTLMRALHPESVPRVLVSDTVGFIKNLPHGLVASFKSTLDEALEASLLAHVVDARDAGFERQLQVTEEVLDEIGAKGVPRLLVFNKIHRGGDEAVARLREQFGQAIS